MLSVRLINWNIASLKSALNGKTKRAVQSKQVLQNISATKPDILGLQEVKIKPTGPTDKELQQLGQLFSHYQVKWRAAQKPAKTSYAGTMMLYRDDLHPQILKPNIMGDKLDLDNEGRIIVLDFSQYYVINAYIPHYEYHRLDLHQEWMDKLTKYLSKMNRKKPVMVAGDLSILLPVINKMSSVNKKIRCILNQQYRDLLGAGFVDAYSVAPNGQPAATWWAPNIPKQSDRGIQTDFWLVSDRFKDRITESGPLDTGERRDHAPIELKIDL